MSFSKILNTSTRISLKVRDSMSKFKYRSMKNSFTPNLISYAVFVSATVIGFSIANTKEISCEIENSSPELLGEKEDLENNLRKKHEKIDYSSAISKSRDLVQRLKDEVGVPGIVVGVSVDGEVIWEEGIGYSDVENRVLCSKDTVMRIGSISKSITMLAVAKLWEQAKLNLDKPIQEYLPYFPAKTFDGKPVDITCRQLVSHLGGIRHYLNEENLSKDADKNKTKEIQEFDLKEYYIKENFNDVKSALQLFQNDPLVSKPGSKFHYTTFGWTLISAVIEATSKQQFTTHITQLFKNLGMMHTYLDLNDVLIYHRSRNYIKNKNGLLVNAPYVDNSYKFAGGGFLSTVGDLIQFSNAILYSFQFNAQESLKDGLPGYLDSKTVQVMWSPIADTKRGKYGMGWEVAPERCECEYCAKCQFCVFHTGMAVGTSSVLFIMPKKAQKNAHLPKGIVVVILANLQTVHLRTTALKIAQVFEPLSLLESS